MGAGSIAKYNADQASMNNMFKSLGMLGGGIGGIAKNYWGGGGGSGLVAPSYNYGNFGNDWLSNTSKWMY
jgi:hypothetical protein